jgi:hypothetical protein
MASFCVEGKSYEAGPERVASRRPLGRMRRYSHKNKGNSIHCKDAQVSALRRGRPRACASRSSQPIENAAADTTKSTIRSPTAAREKRYAYADLPLETAACRTSRGARGERDNPLVGKAVRSSR